MSPPPPPHANPARLKTSLKVAISKLQFIQDKKLAMAKQQRRALADLLSSGKELSARIRCENLVRDDIYVELLEHLELYCELLMARVSLIVDPTRSTCDPGLDEAVSAVIHSAQFSEVKELSQVKDILAYKYGMEFTKRALDNTEGQVPSKVVSRCVIEAPKPELISLYLGEIAKAYKVPFLELDELAFELDEASDTEKETAPEPSGKDSAESSTPASKPTPRSELEDLKARFDALKRI